MYKKFLRTLSILGFLSVISIRVDANTYVDYTELSEDGFEKVYGKIERLKWRIPTWYEEPREAGNALVSMSTSWSKVESHHASGFNGSYFVRGEETAWFRHACGRLSAINDPYDATDIARRSCNCSSCERERPKYLPTNGESPSPELLSAWRSQAEQMKSNGCRACQTLSYTCTESRISEPYIVRKTWDHQIAYVPCTRHWDNELKLLYRERPELIPRGKNDDEVHALFALERYSEAWNLPKVTEECKTLIVRKCQQKIETHVWKSTIADDRMREYYLDRATELIQSFRNAEVQKALWATFEMTKTAKASVLDYAEKCEHPSSLKEATDFINLFQDHYIQTKLKKEFNRAFLEGSPRKIQTLVEGCENKDTLKAATDFVNLFEDDDTRFKLKSDFDKALLEMAPSKIVSLAENCENPNGYKLAKDFIAMFETDDVSTMLQKEFNRAFLERSSRKIQTLVESCENQDTLKVATDFINLFEDDGTRSKLKSDFDRVLLEMAPSKIFSFAKKVSTSPLSKLSSELEKVETFISLFPEENQGDLHRIFDEVRQGKVIETQGLVTVQEEPKKSTGAILLLPTDDL